MQKKKVGLFGGTFDPVHLTHIDIAEASLQQLDLDEIWFLADKHPRRKQNTTAYEHRQEMLRLASQHNDKLITDLLDIQKLGDTHDINTLQRFTSEYPGHEFVIISGLDSILFLDQWEDHHLFIELASFAVVCRPGISLKEFDHLLDRLNNQSLELKYKFIDIGQSEIASSKIRGAIHKKEHKSSLNHKVADYIYQNNLYKS